jgi:hypothetical protein
MVAELVKIHGGTIQAFSKEGQGSIFVINFQIGKFLCEFFLLMIFKGSKHLPPERLVASRTSKTSQSYTRRAEWWIGGLPTDRFEENMVVGTVTFFISLKNLETLSGEKSHILFVDDNADMREYINSLLGEQYDLDIACDGIDALEMIEKRQPELVLTDIMMPRLDGYIPVKKSQLINLVSVFCRNYETIQRRERFQSYFSLPEQVKNISFSCIFTN